MDAHQNCGELYGNAYLDAYEVCALDNNVVGSLKMWVLVACMWGWAGE